jgi:hypothetical protein
MRLCSSIALLALVACAPSAPPPPPPIEVPLQPAPPPTTPMPVAAEEADAAPPSSGGAQSPAEAALSEWRKKSGCSDFDYFPDGGIQNFFCHRPSRVTLASIRALANVDIFLSGPHAKDSLVLDSADSFGHYNPAFVRWLVDVAGPSARESAAREKTQPAYDANVKPLAHVFWKVYAKAQRDKTCFDKEKTAYADLIAKKKLPRDYYERWFFFMNPFFCEKGARKDNFYYDNGFDGGVSGNVTKSVVGFWLRRAMDGTYDAFAEGLKKVIAAYEPDLMKAAPPPDGAAINRALDAATKSASAACREPSSKTPTAIVNVEVMPDGRIDAGLAYMKLRGTAADTCVHAKYAAQSVPAFDGEKMHFSRTITIK